MSDYDHNDSRGRGYTDLLTGSTHLLDIPANALFNYLVKGRLPPIFLPSFLHEATHFWCMASDLGGALALLELRAHRALDDGIYDREQLLHDVGVTSITQQLLRPLLEGMALFQEFDAAPGASSVVSSPGVWAARLFRPLDAPDDRPEDRSKMGDWLSAQINMTLLKYRTSRAAALRKSGALMRSLSSDPHHYLAGYLTVKRIWMNTSHRSAAFCDQDLFLTFLREWIFQDWELISYVLDADLNNWEAAYLLSRRLQARLNELSDTSLEEEAAIFNREKDSPNPDVGSLLRSLHLSERVTLEAQERLRAILSDTTGSERAKEKENWTFADVTTLRHRQGMMRLAFEAVQIEVNEHNRVFVRKGPGIENVYLNGPAPPGAERGTTPGWVAAYFLPAHLAIVVLAVRPDQPMLWMDLAELPEEVIESLRFSVTKVAATEADRRQLTVVGREVAAGLQDADYDLTRRSLPAHVRQVYSRYALGHVPADRVTEVEALLERKGLYDLLGKDGDLLTALVELSLMPQPVNIAGFGGKFLRESLAASGISLDTALRLIRVRQKQAAMTLISAEGDLVLSAV